MNTLIHKPVERVTINIGGRECSVTKQAANIIMQKREALKLKDERISREMRSAHILPSNCVTNGRHASYIAEPFCNRKHKPENMISLDDARHKGIEKEYKAFVFNRARKNKLI